MSDWQLVKGNFRRETWKTRFLKQSGYMPRPKPVRINPDAKKKKVMVKALYNTGWDSKILSIWFKTPRQTILRWTKKVTPEHLMEFEHQFQLDMKDYDNRALVMAKEKMLELLPDETNMDKVVKVAEFFKGVTVKNQTNVQNNIYGDLVKRYSPQPEEK